MKTRLPVLFTLFGLICGGALSADDVSALNARIEAAANKRVAAVSGFFTDEAYLFLGRDRVVKGGRAIGEAFSRLFAGRGPVTIETRHREKGLESEYYYELGFYILKGKTYSYLCKLAPAEGSWKKEFEAVSEKNASIDDVSGIETTQRGVLEVSKARDNGKTVAALYLENGYYLKGGALRRGHGDIAKSWYPNTRFNSLTELAHIQSQDDLVYQIGKYNVGGYAGLYILVWVKVKNDWRVYLDSNV
ncbi:MAG: hypothetical protein JXD23_04220 [Spirochaetales bacterium]|nr:hypothetical protein [Spirochaetales bacterium]